MIVGILGVPYCGSTLLGALLDQCHGVVAAGEVNVLLDNPVTVPCNAHGPSCPVWTPKELRHTSDPVGHAYRVLGRPSVLVLSLKSPALYERLAHVDMALVLFRDPRANALSAHLHEGTDVNAYYAVWAERYSALRVWAAAQPKFLVVSYAALAREPTRVISAVAPHLGVVAPAEITLEHGRMDHQLGGNVGVVGARHIRYDDRRQKADLGTPPAPVMDLHARLIGEAV